jgi:aquaporin Z
VGRRVIAEFVGTFVLVFFAVGSAVFGIDRIGPVGVAFAFGLVLLALVYAIGPISGCHVNPAVTLGVLLNRGIGAAEAGFYVVAQVVGAVVAAGLLKLMVVAGGVTDQTGALGANSWGKSVNLFGALVVEIVLTALLVLVVLRVTRVDATPGIAGLAIGLVLTVVHLVGIPLTGTSVNPARSIGPALFAGPTALSQLWLFIVAPLVGAALGFGVQRVLLLGPTPGSRSAERAPTGAAAD